MIGCSGKACSLGTVAGPGIGANLGTGAGRRFGSGSLFTRSPLRPDHQTSNEPTASIEPAIGRTRAAPAASVRQTAIAGT